MKVIKPLLLGFLCRTYRRQGDRLALTGLVGFSFSDPEVPLSEQAMWQSIGPLLPKDGVWDEGIPKDRGEVLFVARCHGPGGRAVPSRRVVVRVGPVAKALDVTGDRVFIRERGILRRSDPVPFTSLEIDWTRAYGGLGYAANPVGKGFPVESSQDPLPLPNIENPAFPLLSPDERPAPAGLGAQGLLWSGRSSRIGRYRSDEIGKEPPPLPENSDWTLYNQALPDQWLPGAFGGGEPFRLEGLHPDKDIQEGLLPRIGVRSVVTMKDGSVVEVSLSPETLWLFPDLEIGVMIHRGSLPVASDDASEVDSVLLAALDPGEERPLSHYLSVRDRRARRDPGDMSRFSDAPLLPDRLADDPRARLLDVEYHLASTPSTRGRSAPSPTTCRSGTGGPIGTPGTDPGFPMRRSFQTVLRTIPGPDCWTSNTISPRRPRPPGRRSGRSWRPRRKKSTGRWPDSLRRVRGSLRGSGSLSRRRRRSSKRLSTRCGTRRRSPSSTL